MTEYFYLDVSLELSEDSDSILPIYIRGSIEQSLQSIFGEIGGQTTVDILKFDRDSCRGIIRVPENYYIKLRTALALTSQFQDIPCRYKVHSASPVLVSLIGTHINFD